MVRAVPFTLALKSARATVEQLRGTEKAAVTVAEPTMAETDVKLTPAATVVPARAVRGSATAATMAAATRRTPRARLSRRIVPSLVTTLLFRAVRIETMR
jgi:hypothetical protein